MVFWLWFINSRRNMGISIRNWFENLLFELLFWSRSKIYRRLFWHILVVRLKICKDRGRHDSWTSNSIRLSRLYWCYRCLSRWKSCLISILIPEGWGVWWHEVSLPISRSHRIGRLLSFSLVLSLCHTHSLRRCIKRISFQISFAWHLVCLKEVILSIFWWQVTSLVERRLLFIKV